MRLGQRKFMMLVLAAVMLGVFVAAPAALAQGNTTVLGFVYGTGYRFNVALSQVDVEIYAPGVTPDSWVPTGFKSRTDFTGLYVISADLGLPAYYTGYAVKATPVVGGESAQYQEGIYMPVDNSPGTIQAINLQIAVKPTTITGKVTNYRTKKPVKGVKVQCAGVSVKTKANGTFTIANLSLKPLTKQNVQFTKKGYVKKTVKASANPGGTRTLKNVRLVKIP
jgi:hypothetical protein